MPDPVTMLFASNYEPVDIDSLPAEPHCPNCDSVLMRLVAPDIRLEQVDDTIVYREHEDIWSSIRLVFCGTCGYGSGSVEVVYHGGY